MPPTSHRRTPTNIAPRAGRWSANHRKTGIWGWLAFVAIALALGSASGMKTISDSNDGNGESGRADKAYAHAFTENASEAVLVQNRSLPVPDPHFQRTIRDVSGWLKG